MIKSYILNIAAKMGIPPVQVKIVEGLVFVCKDIDMIDITFDDEITSLLINRSEKELVLSGLPCYSLEVKAKRALKKLKRLIAPSKLTCGM